MLDTVEEVEEDKPNTALAWVYENGERRCGWCAELTEDEAQGTFLDPGDHTAECDTCHGPILMSAPTFGEYCAWFDVSTDDREAWKGFVAQYGDEGIEASKDE